MNARDVLYEIATKLTGGEIRIDCTYMVSAASVNLVEVTGETVEGALAEYIAVLLNDDPGRQARLADAPLINASAPAERGNDKRRGARSALRGAENRARILALHQAGRTPRQIMDELGIPSSTVHTHLKAIRTDAAVAATQTEAGKTGAGFRDSG